ncbi:glycosyltransferase, partial [Clostridium perfringens]|nr:glycosyltransferase [Clostridium perfringens]
MKRILFVIDSLNCAGAEKSLISLLNLIDYSKYNVDLQLFGYGGVLESLLPKDVNLLSPLD